jgi:hypothetical protein
MKNIHDVLRQRELLLQQVQKEIEALKLTAQILADESEIANESFPGKTPQPIPVAPPAAQPVTPIAMPSSAVGYSAAWGNTSKQFP